ncbi:hypothetical protein [Sorangium sp. So ce131]|uniref:hypothetical protein n=1 Tax=Sorangium sp. So ce131 TaxID=3133282 RepID=UPI003F6380EF
MLSNPDAPNPTNDPNNDIWVTIGTTHSASTPTNQGLGDWYEWSVNGTPVPTSSQLGRWPEGGLLRFRALDEEGHTMLTFDKDREQCYQTVGMRQLTTDEPEDWIAIGEECRSDFPQAIVVSGSKEPADLAQTPKYLSFMEDESGLGSATETQQYYGAIGAPASLTAFKSQFGFGAAGSDEVSAAYFNKGDLWVGREMHCKSFPSGANTGVACYVSNYGDGVVNFGGNVLTSLQRTVTGAQSGVHTGAFATVAMWYTPPITAHNSVRFVVYGADDLPLPQAQLDTKGFNKGIPQNCIVCHGGGRYDAANNRVVGASATENGARFLPFDLDAFAFSNVSGFSRASQEEKFRKLNKLVLQAAPATTTQQLIQGWYAAGSVNTAGTVQDNSFIPFEWNQFDADEKVYTTVVAPYCRACHASQSNSGLTFAHADDFAALGPLIDFRVCTVGSNPAANHVMPNAEVTLEQFWKSSARAYLSGYLGSRGTCKP